MHPVELTPAEMVEMENFLAELFAQIDSDVAAETLALGMTGVSHARS